MHYGTAFYDGAPTTLPEYIKQVCALGNGDVEQFSRVRQPAYIRQNVYLNGAEHFAQEKSCYENTLDPAVSIIDDGEVVQLEITIPESMTGLITEVVSTETLGMVRIAEQRFEHPNGDKLRLDQDMIGAMRNSAPMPGPLESLNLGKNVIEIWHRPHKGRTSTDRGHIAGMTK